VRSRRRLALAACTALALASLTSGVLVSGAGAKQATTSAARIKIGYINLSNALPFVVIVRKSIEAAAKANGAQLVECDSNENAQQAINCAAEFKSEHVQGIANFQLDATAAPRVCAAGPKVPVVAVDIPQPPCQTMFFGANNVYAGKLAGVALGKFAKKAWGCKADAVLSLNDLAAGSVVIQRENGSLSGLASICPGLKVVHVATDATNEGSIAPFTNALSTLPGAHHLLVVATNDDQANGAIKAAQAAGRLNDIYIGAQGGDPTSWPSLCGTTPFKHWEADTAYFPERYGATIVPALISLIEGQKEPKVINTNHQVLTPQNIRFIYPKACK
jgi:ribose transport system substrate-binding protein